MASAIPALGKLICRTSPLALCKSIKIETSEGKLRLSTCGLNEEVSFEIETGGEEVFCCVVGFDEFRDAIRTSAETDMCRSWHWAAAAGISPCPCISLGPNPKKTLKSNPKRRKEICEFIKIKAESEAMELMTPKSADSEEKDNSEVKAA